jgi:hypothetical protein
MDTSIVTYTFLFNIAAVIHTNLHVLVESFDLKFEQNLEINYHKIL